jgi:hypothetical protein
MKLQTSSWLQKFEKGLSVKAIDFTHGQTSWAELEHETLYFPVTHPE